MNTFRTTIRILGAATLLTAAPVLRAQVTDSTATKPVSAMDSAFARARQLVIAGQTAAGRQIADSILSATPVTSPAYGNALFGRAQLAPTAADAERDYQRIIVEYPLSTHAGDALLQLAQIERSRGDRAAAIAHLRRYLQENPGNAKRARTGFWLAQLLFEQNDDTAACPVLHDAQLAVDPSNVELQNQMNFYTTRCRVAEARAAADSASRADSVRADSVAQADARRKASERTHAKAPARTASPSKTRAPENAGGNYAVQVGAYGARAEADQAVDRLHARGIEARVDGTAKPFRVRIGHYTTKAAAAKALAEFKKLGIDGFVTSTGGR
jgi:cell division protein FtsN